MRILAILLLLMSVVAAGCGGDAPPAGDSAPVSMAAAPGAAQGPMCVEHGVLEAVCTKCNPALVPVFQAKGDWCAEHRFPESFCPTCHPERGGVPQAVITADNPPADGTRIRFRTRETARLAGIETVQAVESPHQTGVAAVGRLVYDATRVAQVNARAAGVVRVVHVDVGARVRRGAALADLESAAVGDQQSRLQSAEARLRLAETAQARATTLFEKGIVPAKDVQVAQQELEAARAEHGAAQAGLRVVGANGGAGLYTLSAPLGGVVTRRDIHVGTLVEPSQVLFEIVDPTSMWAEIDVPEADLAAVRPGQTVTITVDGLGDREFTGRIEYIAPAVDPHTRTTTARARLANPDGVLRANMYVRARIEVGEVRHGVLVPPEAVQQARGVPVVFVRLAEDLYETRRVDLGLADAGGVEVRRGVRPGEPVVTQGSFLLKTETLKESIGAGCCDVEEK